MPKPFRLALMGAGMVARNAHLPAALASDKVQVVALVEPRRKQAEELARWYGIAPVIVPQVQEMVAKQLTVDLHKAQARSTLSTRPSGE